MAFSHKWVKGTLLFVAAILRLPHALRSPRIPNMVANPGNGGGEDGLGLEGTSSGEALTKAAAKVVAKGNLKGKRPHRDNGIRELRPIEAKKENTAVTAPERSSKKTPERPSERASKRTSKHEAGDDVVVILEDHTDCMPPRLLRVGSRPVAASLEDVASIEPQLTELDRINDHTNVMLSRRRAIESIPAPDAAREIASVKSDPTHLDWHHGSEVEDLDGQVTQRIAAISNLCNDRLRMFQLDDSKLAFDRDVVLAAMEVVRSSLGNGRSRKKQAELARTGSRAVNAIQSYWSLSDLLRRWKEDPPTQCEVAEALLDACKAMSRRPMQSRQRQKLIMHYDQMIRVLQNTTV